MVTTVHGSGAELRARESNDSKNERIDLDLMLKSIKSVTVVSKEEKKQQASKPLYLVRYE